jgi:hypothetical protein
MFGIGVVVVFDNHGVEETVYFRNCQEVHFNHNRKYDSQRRRIAIESDHFHTGDNFDFDFNLGYGKLIEFWTFIETEFANSFNEPSE